MVIKKSNIIRTGEAILISFDGDNDIYTFYDPMVKVSTIYEIKKDIVTKLICYGNEMEYYIIYYNKKIIGYFACLQNMLISFGLNTKYRTKKILSDFFTAIINKAGKEICCYLYSINTRAINWLKKNGMQIEKEFNYNNIAISKLNYTACQ